MNETPTGYVKYEFTTFSIQQLEGKLLTLVDATFPDREQRKAFKDILRQSVWDWAIRENMHNATAVNTFKGSLEELRFTSNPDQVVVKATATNN